MTPLTTETLMQLAAALGVPLDEARAAALVGEVAGLFAFTRELDALVASEVMPATVFDVDPGDG
jgi:hypothetical protein